MIEIQRGGQIVLNKGGVDYFNPIVFSDGVLVWCQVSSGCGSLAGLSTISPLGLTITIVLNIVSKVRHARDGSRTSHN